MYIYIRIYHAVAAIMAAGRSPSYGELEPIKAWLKPWITSVQCFGYPANRSLSATDKVALCSDKYQKLFEEGYVLVMAL